MCPKLQDGLTRESESQVASVVALDRKRARRDTFDDVAVGHQLFGRMLAEEMACHQGQTRFRCKNGNQLWLSLSVALNRAAGGVPAYFLGIA
jgi:hypothetical protein